MNLSRSINRIASPLMMMFFLMAACEQFYQSLHWGHKNWCMTECLINYAGGFVRRGLFGQTACSLSDLTGVSAHILIITISIIMFLALSAFLCCKSNGRLPLIVIFSPIVLGGPTFQDFLVRKDTLCIVLLIACLLFEKSKSGLWIRNLLINIIGIVAILCHEGFIFYGFTAILAVRYFSAKESIYKSIAGFSPMILAFLLASFFHGNESTAVSINNSLITLWHQIDPKDSNLYSPSGAIYSLKYNFKNCPWNGYSVLWEVNYHIYAPLAWLGTILICFVYLLHLVNVENNKYNTESKVPTEVERNRLFVVLSLQLISISPLFFIGWDYGRWIFLWITSSVAIYFIGLNWENPILQKVIAQSYHYSKFMRLPWLPQRWHLLFFGIPLCSWSVFSYLQATPLGYQFDFLLKVLTHKSLFDTIYPLVRLQG